MEHKRALIIMVKNPVEGKVKTRLAMQLGNAEALVVYKKLLDHTSAVTAGINADKYIFYSDVVERNDMFGNTQYKKYVQCSGELGTRMEYAFSIPFKNEYKEVVMIGADCYEITSQHIETAFQKLAENDFVIGPATDGGYYLIGMKKWNRWVLQNKPWSTANLFQETSNDIISKNGKLFMLDMLSDIDTVEDLQKFPALN